jgi:hypothetical protein
MPNLNRPKVRPIWGIVSNRMKALPHPPLHVSSLHSGSAHLIWPWAVLLAFLFRRGGLITVRPLMQVREHKHMPVSSVKARPEKMFIR